MNAAIETKLVSVTPPAAIVDDAAYTCASVDCSGWAFAKITAYLGATDIAMVALKVTESDNDSDYSDVTGLIFGTSANLTGSTSTLPSATDDNKFFVFDVDLRGRKRYLKLAATAGNGTAGTFLAAWAELSRPAIGPTTAAERGASQILRVG